MFKNIKKKKKNRHSLWHIRLCCVATLLFLKTALMFAIYKYRWCMLVAWLWYIVIGPILILWHHLGQHRSKWLLLYNKSFPNRHWVWRERVWMWHIGGSRNVLDCSPKYHRTTHTHKYHTMNILLWPHVHEIGISHVHRYTIPPSAVPHCNNFRTRPATARLNTIQSHLPSVHCGVAPAV